MFEGRDPRTGELLGRPHGRNAVPAFDMALRPTKSVSVLYGLGDSATGRRSWPPHHAGLAEAVAHLDEHLGFVVAVAVSSTCPARECRRSGSTTDPSSTATVSSSTHPGGCGMAATRSLRPCRRCRSRPTRPPWSCPTRVWRWCRSWPSTAPRSPGARSWWRVSRSWRPGGCQACVARSVDHQLVERAAVLVAADDDEAVAGTQGL